MKWSAIILFLICIIQFFTVEFYWNDKTTTSAHIIQSMQKNHTFYSKDLDCYNPTRDIGKYPAWAEEPPVFHYVALFLKSILGDNSLRVFPLICYFFSITGILYFIKELTDGNTLSRLSMYLAFVPSLYIHASRFLPDVFAMTLMIWGIAFFLKKRFLLSWCLMILAVTTKALVIVPLFSLVLVYLFLERKNINLEKLSIMSSFGLTIVPTFIWFYILKSNGIENPFFKINISIAHHSGGSDWSILIVKKYWSKIFQWHFYRGIGIASLAVLIHAYAKKRSEFCFNEKLVSVAAMLFLVNVIVFRGPQISAPWYSFYFQVLFIFAFSFAFIKLKSKTQWGLIILNAIISFNFLSYGQFKNVSYMDSVTQLPCHFHEVMNHH
jgi:hypothetical protein